MGILCCKRPAVEADPTEDSDIHDIRLDIPAHQEQQPSEVSTASSNSSGSIIPVHQRSSTSSDSLSQQEQHEIENSEGSDVIYTAMFDLERLGEDCLRMKVGDRFKYISTKDTWLRLQNCKTKEIGYIPSNFVQLESSIESCSWFYGMITLKEAETLLDENEYSNAFLVTERKKDPGSYTLSYKAIDSGMAVIRHKPIHHDGKEYYITGEPKYFSLKEVVDHFKDKNSFGDHACTHPEPTIYGLTTTDDKLHISFDTLTLGNVIGNGNFCTVYEGTCTLIGGRQVAVKQLNGECVNETLLNQEVNVMKQLRHENVVCLLAVCMEKGFYIVTELMARGSLFTYLRIQRHEGGLKTGDILIIAKKIAAGMQYLESKHFVHRDLAARNVLLGEQGKVKVSDFGMAKKIKNELYISPDEKEPKPIRWCAPETLLPTDPIFTHSSDIWSFAIVLVEMFEDGEQPYPGLSTREVVDFVQSGKRHEKPEKCPPEVYSLMKLCWKEQPEERPNFSDVYDNIFKLIEEDPHDQVHFNVAFDSSEEDTDSIACEIHSSDRGDKSGTEWRDRAHDSEDANNLRHICPVCKQRRNHNEPLDGTSWRKCVSCDFWFHALCVTSGQKDNGNRDDDVFMCNRCRQFTF